MVNNTFRALPAIYDAALEQDHWITARNEMTKPTGRKATVLLVVEHVGIHPYNVNQLSDLYRTHITSEDLQFYINNYSPLEIEAWQIMKTKA